MELVTDVTILNQLNNRNRKQLDQEAINRLTDTDLAYIAGLFDGEGNITLTYSKRFRYEIGICNTDKQIIEICTALFSYNRRRDKELEITVAICNLNSLKGKGKKGVSN